MPEEDYVQNMNKEFGECLTNESMEYIPLTDKDHVQNVRKGCGQCLKIMGVIVFLGLFFFILVLLIDRIFNNK